MQFECSSGGPLKRGGWQNEAGRHLVVETAEIPRAARAAIDATRYDWPRLSESAPTTDRHVTRK